MVNFQTIRVSVTPKNNGPFPAGDVPCSITPIDISGGGSVVNDTITLDQGQGPFCIQFVLDARLLWDANDPIWIKPNKCPNSRWSNKKIWIDDTPENNELTILNMNVGNAAKLHYQLNFEGGRYCDPIMENGGGNIF